VSSVVQSSEPLARVRSFALGIEWRLAALYGVVAAVLGIVVTHAHDWFVMTDELLYERLAIHASHTLSPLPSIHGHVIGNLNQLYPLLIAPLFGHGNVPASLTAAHFLNALVMASAALPVFALARELQPSRAWALVAAGVSVAGPWMVLSSFLLTENVAYPAFCWAVWGIERSLARPGRSHDAAALLLIFLATFARVQLVVLLPAFALVAAVQELRYRDGRSWREVLRRHDVLFGVVAGLAVCAALLALTGRLASAFGTYSVTAHGSIVPLGSFGLALRHLAVLSLGFGILPLVVGLGWALVTVARPDQARRHAFALLTVVLVTGMSIQVGSFAVRFGGSVVRDRYLFYVVPLLLVATAIYASAGRLSALAPILGGVVFAAGIAMQGPTFRYEGLFADSPSSVAFLWLWRIFHPVGGVRVAYLVAGLGLVAALAIAELTVLAPRVVAPLVAVVSVACALTFSVVAFDRLFTRTGTAGRPVSVNQGHIFEWIDNQVPPGKSIAILPFQTVFSDFWSSAAVWWDVEFWNEGVDRALTLGTSFAWTPPGTFPTIGLHVNPQTGVIREAPADYLVSAPADMRLQIVQDRVGADRNLQLGAVPKPWRASWMTLGMSRDGYVLPHRTGTIRVFAEPGQTRAERRTVTWTVAVPSEATHTLWFTANTVGRTLSPSEVTQVSTDVCVPAGGHADILVNADDDALISLGAPFTPATVSVPRHVAVRLADLSLSPASRGCRV
jgi:hypothetical protein